MQSLDFRLFWAMTPIISPLGKVRNLQNIMTSTLNVHSFIPLPCAECDDSVPFSGASSIPLCYILFPPTLLHQLFFNPPSLHLSTYFLVYLFILLIPSSNSIIFWEFYFLPFSVHVQTKCNLCSLIVSVMVGFFNNCMNFFITRS
jgi:hypothetical protein